MSKRLPISENPPAQGEEWSKIEADFDKVILPGITAWQHPSFFAYFPGSSKSPSEIRRSRISILSMIRNASQYYVRINSRRYLRGSGIESRIQLGLLSVVHRIGGSSLPSSTRALADYIAIYRSS